VVTDSAPGASLRCARGAHLAVCDVDKSGCMVDKPGNVWTTVRKTVSVQGIDRRCVGDDGKPVRELAQGAFRERMDDVGKGG